MRGRKETRKDRLDLALTATEIGKGGERKGQGHLSCHVISRVRVLSCHLYEGKTRRSGDAPRHLSRGRVLSVRSNEFAIATRVRLTPLRCGRVSSLDTSWRPLLSTRRSISSNTTTRRRGEEGAGGAGAGAGAGAGVVLARLAGLPRVLMLGSLSLEGGESVERGCVDWKGTLAADLSSLTSLSCEASTPPRVEALTAFYSSLLHICCSL